MLKKIIDTLGTRFICVIIVFLTTMFNTNFFHAEGVGTISLFVLGVSILQILSSIFGSAALIYALNQYDAFQLLFINYISTIITNIVGSFVLCVFNFVPFDLLNYLILASVSISIFSINNQMFLSKEKIGYYNLSILLQQLLVILLTLFCVFILKINNYSAYIKSYVLGHILLSIGLFFPAIKDVKYKGFSGIKNVFVQVIKLGFAIQLANLAQLLNYRLGIYFVEFCAGRKSVGLYDCGTKVSEAVWIVPKSIAPIQYARVANSNNKKYASEITILLAKMVLLFAFVVVFILILLPKHWFALIFGPEFSEIKPLIYIFAPGILFFSANTIFAHYFAGLGKYYINTINSVIGLVITVVLGFIFVPIMKNLPYMQTICIAAAITSMSYLATCLFSFIFFLKDANAKLKQLLITKNDVSLLKKEIKTFLKKFQR